LDLYLIRHAEAFPEGEQGITNDFDRPLTEKGKGQARRIAAALKKRGVRLELLATSPLVRAKETADLLMQGGDAVAPELEVCDHLAPGGKRKKLASFLIATARNAIGLVGHQPDLGDLAAWLIGSREANLAIGKGGVACINSTDAPGKGSGKLLWLVTNEWLE
jgi:phosphohistidine phosphatase